MSKIFIRSFCFLDRFNNETSEWSFSMSYFPVIDGLYPHFTKDFFGPDSTRSIFLVDRPHICETIGNLRTITAYGTILAVIGFIRPINALEY